MRKLLYLLILFASSTATMPAQQYDLVIEGESYRKRLKPKLAAGQTTRV